MPQNASTCAAPHCGIRNRHRDDCDETTCIGCLPRWAADGLHLCWVCVRRISEDAHRAAELHEDLTLTLIHRRAPGERTSGSGDRAPAVDGEVVEARTAIKVTLVSLARLIAEQRGFSIPDDSVPQIAEFVARSAEWLAAHPLAGDHANDLRDIVSDPRTWRLAYPARSDRLYIGDCPLTLVDLDGNQSVCGTRLYQLADEPLVHCPGCDTDETIEWWQRKIAGDAGGWVDAYALAAHLSMRWKRPVDPGTIKKWGQRTGATGVEPKHHVEVRGEEQVKVVDRDDKGRALYDLNAALDYARRTWGEPA